MVSCQRGSGAAEARAIVTAMRTLQTHPELMDAARRDLPATLDRIGLSGIARHAVAATVALSVSGVMLVPGTPVFWSA
jgi:uncharacterized protein YcaQ